MDTKVYEPLCEFLGIKKKQQTCEKYPHFLKILHEFVKIIKESIKTKPFGKQLLSSDGETKKCVQEIIEATQNYNFHEREKVISQNLKPITHPYFTAYKPLQKLCLAILRHRKIGFARSKNEAYGILFDGAWLWEEYLWTVLKSKNFLHPKNKKHSGGIKMFDNDVDEESFDKNHRRIYPDFYRLESPSDKGFILDAKYKRLQNGVAREDLYQIVTYMHTMKIDNGGFVYPIPQSNFEKDKKTYKLANCGGEVHLFAFPIPFESDKKTFRAQMSVAEKQLASLL